MNRRRFVALSTNAISAHMLANSAIPIPTTEASGATAPERQIYTYDLQSSGSSIGQRHGGDAMFRGGEAAFDGSNETYDEIVAAACFQGLINREAPRIYLLDSHNPRPAFWFKRLSERGRWLEGVKTHSLKSLDDLRELASDEPKGIVIWDPNVPASINVAATVAAVRSGIVCSPDLAKRYAAKWNLITIDDLRGRFSGSETGSKKNDAYRWAIREYLAKGLCSSRRAFLSEDAYFTRAHGNPGYAISYDWILRNHSFVFDLSPWSDEPPADDPGQTPGTDRETYRMILSELCRQADGKHMTEIVGFFAFDKYSKTEKHQSHHDPVPTELESVWLMSPYNCYQSSISTGCYNQTFHCQFPRETLKQSFHPVIASPVSNKTYISIVMADYDSAGLLYEFLPRYWHDVNRGRIPLAWGVNPNLVDSYPDLFDYFYHSATRNDTFVSDANAAGYSMVNRVLPDAIPLFVRHNKHYFETTDMTIAPVVIDFDQPTAMAKDAYREFAPDGMASVVDDTHSGTGKPPAPQVWKGMPVMEMINDASASLKNGTFIGANKLSEIMAGTIIKRGSRQPGFYLYRITWLTPTQIMETMSALRNKLPELEIELLDIQSFLSLFKQKYASKQIKF